MTEKNDIVVQGIVGMIVQGIAGRNGRLELIGGKYILFVLFVAAFGFPIGKGNIAIAGFLFLRRRRLVRATTTAAGGGGGGTTATITIAVGFNGGGMLLNGTDNHKVFDESSVGDLLGNLGIAALGFRHGILRGGLVWIIAVYSVLFAFVVVQPKATKHTATLECTKIQCTFDIRFVMSCVGHSCGVWESNVSRDVVQEFAARA
jgi:hypothetical protein